MGDLWNKMLGILQAPFVDDLDLIHLFLLVGLILVFIGAWAMILDHVRDAAAEIVE